jgi:Raf kinase inhibitor-like YbhB/YbcL family protein
MKLRHFIFLPIFFIALSAHANPKKEVTNTMELTSPNFKHQTTIPKKHTCDGGDVSPELDWSGAPAGTQSYALIVDDPDAPDPANPKMTWVHWVIYNIPAQSTLLPESDSGNDLPEGSLNGINEWKRTGYGGPCPPIGTHRYFHKLYALDVVLPDLENPTKKDLEKAMDGHILEKTELVGLYHR